MGQLPAGALIDATGDPSLPGGVTLLLPAGFDDPGRPSGGNVYDRRIAAGLADAGWGVRVVTARGRWPDPDRAALDRLATDLAGLPDGTVVLADGLVACPSAEAVLTHARRLRLVVLLHMPLGLDTGGAPPAAAAATTAPAAAASAAERAVASQRAVLTAAAAVVTTSDWTREWVTGAPGLPADRVTVARPGVDPADPAPGASAGSAPGPRILSVGPVLPHKGHDVLVDALASLRHESWKCTVVGAADTDGGYAERVRLRIAEAGLRQRIRLAGVLTGAVLSQAYCAADLLVAPSRAETYGMVVTEALARGLPVIASDIGGLPEAIGVDPDGRRPGMLVTAGDPTALAAALRTWLTDGEARRTWRAAALRRREALDGWPDTTRRVAAALRAAR